MRICIADDNAAARRVPEMMLTDWGYEVVAVENGAQALQVLQADDGPKLAILDWMMPERDGVQVCQELRRCPRDTHTYLLLLTARTCKEDLIQGLKAGADDYLVKPFEPDELQARLYAGRRILDLQDQLLAAREAMRLQATRNALTGFWNRRAILEILERELSRAQREQTPLGLILADLDHFKRVNHTFGHLAGDAVLVEAARRMGTAIRPYDTLGRYGGEEFLIVLPGCDAANTVKLAERLRQRISETPIAHGGQLLPVTTSQGLAVFPGTGTTDLTGLLQAADAALYRAKDNGRNRAELSSC
jgi:diguanylate cyclase (GGDEF)-like protein